MKKESKLKLGLFHQNRIYFSDEEKMTIINDYLSGNETKNAVYARYTGKNVEHGKLIKWMRNLGIEDKFKKNTNFVSVSKPKKAKELIPALASILLVIRCFTSCTNTPNS